MALRAVVCCQMGCIPLNMTPLGNRPFPSKKWGRGQIGRDTCSIGNHLLEESKNSHKTVSASGISCWIQREGGGGGGQWLNVFLVVPFLFQTHSNTHKLTHNTYIQSGYFPELASALCFYIWGSFGRCWFDCVSENDRWKEHPELLWAQSFSGGTHPFHVHRIVEWVYECMNKKQKQCCCSLTGCCMIYGWCATQEWLCT